MNQQDEIVAMEVILKSLTADLGVEHSARTPCFAAAATANSTRVPEELTRLKKTDQR